MAEGIAKSSSSPAPKQVDIPKTPDSTAPEMSGVPIDLFRYFNVDLGTQEQSKLNKMASIYEFLSGEGESTIGDKLSKLRDLESKLGMSGFDSRIDKLYNYLKVAKQAQEITKKLRAMEVRGGDW